MPVLLMQILAAVLGVGLLKYFLERYTNWSARIQWTVTTVSVVLLAIVTYVYQEYPTWPRHLGEWQREAILARCPTVKPVSGRITYYLGFPSDILEADDYSHELMNVFADRGCHLSIAYGHDPFPRDIVVNQGKVVVPPDNNVLLRVQGLQLWVETPKHPPLAAKQLAAALDAGGLRFSWQQDIRLSGIAAEGAYRFPINGPDCILIVGTKPPWSLCEWWFTQKRHLTWDAKRLQAYTLSLF